VIGDDLMRVIEVIADPKRLAACRREVAALAKKMNEVEKKATNTGSAVVDGERFRSLRTGNVTLSDGIYVVNPATGYTTTAIEPTGEVYHGYNVDRPEGLSLGIWANRKAWNRETMEAGDVLMGDNSTAAANLKWNRVLKRLEFRGGQTVQAYVDTDGAIYFGGGNGWMDANGLKILEADAYSTNHSLDFVRGSIVESSVYGEYNAGLTRHWLNLKSNPVAGMESWWLADSTAPAGQPAYLELQSKSGVDNVTLTMIADDLGVNDCSLGGAPFRLVSNYIELDEIAAPANPAANKLRLYAKDVLGTTRLCYKDSAGAETIVT
jgi:hypothetical protein